MISLDQVLLLEQKVESAVEKIKQLEGENAALRNKCSELTNALSAKTEQLTAFESEQKTIESGIIKAIDRLNSIEHSVLKKADSIEKAAPVEEVPQVPAEPAVPEEPEVPAEPDVIDEDIPAEIEIPVEPEPQETASPAADVSFDQMMPVEESEEPPFEEIPVEEPIEDESDDSDSDPETKDQLGFDIF